MLAQNNTVDGMNTLKIGPGLWQHQVCNGAATPASILRNTLGTYKAGVVVEG
jgi:hypothetical protein